MRKLKVVEPFVFVLFWCWERCWVDRSMNGMNNMDWTMAKKKRPKELVFIKKKLPAWLVG